MASNSHVAVVPSQSVTVGLLRNILCQLGRTQFLKMDTCVVSNWMAWMQVSIYAKYVSVSRRMTKSIVRRWVELQRVSKTASRRWCRFLDEHGGGDKRRGMDWCVFVMTGGIVVCFLLTRSDTTHTHAHTCAICSLPAERLVRLSLSVKHRNHSCITKSEHCSLQHPPVCACECVHITHKDKNVFTESHWELGLHLGTKAVINKESH